MRRRFSLRSIWLAIAVATWWCVPVGAQDLLFENHDVLELVVRAPMKSLTRDSANVDLVSGSIELADGTEIPVTIFPYGTSRLKECTMPLLKFETTGGGFDNTVFDGLDVLRLVTPCHLNPPFDKFVLLEYLAYASYAVVAEPALRVRLVSCRFLDTERSAFEQTSLAFFVEEIGDVAKHHHAAWLDLESQSIDDLDPKQATTLALFQFMIGNTDWSAVAAARGNRCCHNVAALNAEGNGYNAVLPFDFDQAGLVNAPYAQPDQQLAIRSVTQRVYRGFCAFNHLLPEVISTFNQRWPELERIFSREELPDPKTRQRALKYIKSFYEIINNPRKVENKLLAECR